MASRYPKRQKKTDEFIRCDSFENYKNPINAVWTDAIDDEILAAIPPDVWNGVRAETEYHNLPLSFKNYMWCVKADDLTPNYHDATITPKTDLLHALRNKIWDNMVCKEGPWKRDCDAFYERKQKWDNHIAHSYYCHTKWTEQDNMRKAYFRQQRISEKVAEKRSRIQHELSQSMHLLNPQINYNQPESIKAISDIRERVRCNNNLYAVSMPHQDHPVISFLEAQCVVADYFHDGLPGFRNTNRHYPRICGVAVTRKSLNSCNDEHRIWMYQFLLRNIGKQDNDTIQQGIFKFNLQNLSSVSRSTKGLADENQALDKWRKDKMGLENPIETSIQRVLNIPSESFDCELQDIINTNPIIVYNLYLNSGNRTFKLKLNLGNIKRLTTTQARRVIELLLRVLFGPIYNNINDNLPALFTFDANKGYIKHLIAMANLNNVGRLITPYNIADSAMTERFNNDSNMDNDEALIEEEADAIVARGLGQQVNVEEEDDNDDEPQAQRGLNSFKFIAPLITSNTQMFFDDHWQIAYLDRGFSEINLYDFSMILMDRGLHEYNQYIGHRIPSSLYTVEAPFSTYITRGPSLNYLLLGLLRGHKSVVSDVFPRINPNNINPNNIHQMYDTLIGLKDNLNSDEILRRLLPIYTIRPSNNSLPLFQHIAKAPLFALRMLYDLQHHLSALPSRIKWAGDYEQYMALKDSAHGVFVTLDITCFYCANAHNIRAIAETRDHLMIVGEIQSDDYKAEIRTEADRIAPEPAVLQSRKRKMGSSGGVRRTHKKDRSSNIVLKPGRDYFLLGWLYPLVMAVYGAFRDRHRAENAAFIAKRLLEMKNRPELFLTTHTQFIDAVSRIPNVPTDLVKYSKTLTANTCVDIVPKCLEILQKLYATRVSIFSNEEDTRTIISYLHSRRRRLNNKFKDKDSTLNTLRSLLTQKDRETACLTLALLFERLHGRIQNGTSYLGHILNIIGGPVLERVDDQASWIALTDVLKRDRMWLMDHAPAVMPVAQVEPVNVNKIALAEHVALVHAMGAVPNSKNNLTRKANRGRVNKSRAQLNHALKMLKTLKPSQKSIPPSDRGYHSERSVPSSGRSSPFSNVMSPTRRSKRHTSSDKNYKKNPLIFG